MFFIHIKQGIIAILLCLLVTAAMAQEDLTPEVTAEPAHSTPVQATNDSTHVAVTASLVPTNTLTATETSTATVEMTATPAETATITPETTESAATDTPVAQLTAQPTGVPSPILTATQQEQTISGRVPGFGVRVEDQLWWYAYNAMQSTWIAPQAYELPETDALLWGDFDGNQQFDLLLYAESSGWRVALQTDAGFQMSSPALLFNRGQTIVAKNLDADPQTELIVQEADQSVDVYAWNARGFIPENLPLNQTFPQTAALVADVDGNGITESIQIAEDDATQLYVNLNQQQLLMLSPSAQPIGMIQALDLQGDHTAEILVFLADNRLQVLDYVDGQFVASFTEPRPLAQGTIITQFIQPAIQFEPTETAASLSITQTPRPQLTTTPQPYEAICDLFAVPAGEVIQPEDVEGLLAVYGTVETDALFVEQYDFNADGHINIMDVQYAFSFANRACP